MKVTLLSYTPNALDLLLFTKNTRLTMNGATLADIAAWPQEKKLAELEYMRNTIQSSWEFVDYPRLHAAAGAAPHRHQLRRAVAARGGHERVRVSRDGCNST
jgi:hypothetical protein